MYTLEVMINPNMLNYIYIANTYSALYKKWKITLISLIILNLKAGIGKDKKQSSKH